MSEIPIWTALCHANTKRAPAIGWRDYHTLCIRNGLTSQATLLETGPTNVDYFGALALIIQYGPDPFGVPDDELNALYAALDKVQKAMQAMHARQDSTVLVWNALQLGRQRRTS